jgi:hypothetical protein
VLFYDVGNDGLITEKREYVFTEWDPTATSDLKALLAKFDSNGDGKLTALDAEFSKFKVMVTNADGTQTAKTLIADGDGYTITDIELRNATVANITLPDGSKITGQSTFTGVVNGQTITNGQVADATLVAEADGHRVVQTTTNNAGTVTVVTKAYDASGNLAYGFTSVTSSNGLAISTSYDDNGDGIVDRLQSITTVVNANASRTETVINSLGNTPATAILQNRTVTTTSADGKSVNIQRDSNGGGWFDQIETRSVDANGVRSETIGNYAKDGVTLLSQSTETVDAAGIVRNTYIDADGSGGVGGYETRDRERILVVNGVRTTEFITYNHDATTTVRHQEKEVLAVNGRDKVISRDKDGNGTFQTTDLISSVVVNTVNQERTETTYDRIAAPPRQIDARCWRDQSPPADRHRESRPVHSALPDHFASVATFRATGRTGTWSSTLPKIHRTARQAAR